MKNKNENKLNYRSEVRKLAVQYLYAAEINPAGAAEQKTKMIFQSEILELERYRQFFLDIVTGVVEHRQALDDKISHYLINWKINRLVIIERCILRMAFWELDYYDTPTSVVAAEAVELCHLYGDEEAPTYVNGIIGKKVRDNLHKQTKVQTKSEKKSAPVEAAEIPLKEELHSTESFQSVTTDNADVLPVDNCSN